MPKSTALRLVFLSAGRFLLCSFVFAQKTVTGIVKDSKGPVVGATVIVKGTNAATISGTDKGTFSITLPKGRSTVVISSVSYDSKEIQ